MSLDLEAVLDCAVSHLEAGKEAEDEGIPNVTTVTKGDFPTPNATKIQITADWAGSNYSGGVGLQGSLMGEDTDIAIRGYLSDVPNDDVHRQAARELRTTIVNWMRKMTGYILVPRSSRYILPAEKPDFRFTIGAEVRYAVKQFG